MTWQVLHSDCLDAMKEMDEASVDSIVCDPPAGISFMGREWDHHKGGRDAWVEWMAEVMRECLRVAKPGAHALIWALPRTSHRTGWAIEEAGWTVRDRIAHHFGSGFPKSHNLGNGQGTALKPATEDWWLARKPLIGTVAANVERWGCGALNIAATRIGADSTERQRTDDDFGLVNDDGWEPTPGVNGSPAGRWPANVCLSHLPECERVGERRVKSAGDGGSTGQSMAFGVRTPGKGHADPDGLETVDAWRCAEGCPVAELDRQSGDSVSRAATMPLPRTPGDSLGAAHGNIAADSWRGHNDTGGASRFFYTAKASRAERNAGLEGFEERESRRYGDRDAGALPQQTPQGAIRMQNVHPTVKPIALMRWLCRLVTPPGGLILDPFVGSGTTGIAAVLEDFDFIGIEREAEYVEIARARIAWWESHKGREADQILELTRRSENERERHDSAGQMGLFGETPAAPSSGRSISGRSIYGDYGEAVVRCPEHGASIPSGSTSYRCGCPIQRGEPARRAS